MMLCKNMRQENFATIISRLVSYQTLCLKGKHRCSFTWRQRPADRAKQYGITTKIRMTQLVACSETSVKRLEIKDVCVCLTNQSGQGAVWDGGRETNNNKILLIAELLHLYTLFRHHVQLLQGVGLLRVPDGPNHICMEEQLKSGKAIRIKT